MKGEDTIVNRYLFYLLLLSAFLVIPEISRAQETDPYLPFAEQMPEPIGGVEAIYKKVVYPDEARKAGLEGKVYVQIYVDETGTVTDVKVLKDIGMGCGKAAIEAIKRIKYKHAVNKGAPAKVKMAMAINFKLK